MTKAKRLQAARDAERDPELQRELARVRRALTEQSELRREVYEEALRFRKEMEPLSISVDELLHQGREQDAG